MSALNLKPPPMMVLLAAGAALWLMSRRANAATNPRSPLNPSSGVAAQNSRFFVSPSQAGDSLAQQAATAARNAQLLAGPLGSLWSKFSSLAPSVTSALPSDFRQAEKASYDVNPTADTLATGDFARADRSAVSADAIAGNGPGNADPYNLGYSDGA